MRSSTIFFTSLLAFLPNPATAIRAVPSQQCANACGNVTSTSISDIVCSDTGFDNTPEGQALLNCLNCQQNSTANDPNTGESDLRWFIYNLRYTMSTCLWGYPDNSSVLSTPCTTNPACGLYQSAMEFGSLESNASTFDYCANFNNVPTTQQTSCQNCLQQLRDDFYLSNFFIALVAGCQQKPNLGSTLSLQGTLFSTNPINITAPVPTTTAVAYALNANGLTLGAIVGAVIGVLVVLLTLLGCCIVWCGKRRRRQALQEARARLNRNEVKPASDNPEPKWSQDVPAGWSQDDTPTSAGGYGSDKQYFSPYISQHTSPVSARDMLNSKVLWDEHQLNTIVAGPGVHGLGIQNEAFELAKLRDQRIEERKAREQKLHQEFLQDAAERGFTTAPTVRLPNLAKR